MTLSERQSNFAAAYRDLEGFSRRRAYIATQYAIHRDLDKIKAEQYRLELSSIDQQAKLKYEPLRRAQSRYLVEYEMETVDADTGRLTDRSIKEELYFLVNCNLDTFSNGWDLDNKNAEELLYEINDYFVQYKSTRCLVVNVKQV